MVNFAREIKQIRKTLGVNQAEFAEMVDASQGSVSKWERGVENPRTNVWLRIKSIVTMHEGRRTSSGFVPLYQEDLPFTPVIVPVVGILDRETMNDAAGGRIDPLMNLTIPRTHEVKGNVYAWIVSEIRSIADDIPSGTIVFADCYDEGYSPEIGERVILQHKGQHGESRYSIRYYGRSTRGFEWFTTAQMTEEKVKLSTAHLIDERDKLGMHILGPHIASLKWESPILNFLDKVTENEIF